MEPDPSERFLSAADQARIAELQAMIEGFKAEQAASERRWAATRARVAAAANAIHPGATDLVQAAAADPNVTPQNAASWFRSKLPSVSVETKEMLVHALGVLFLAALNAAAQNAISQQEAARPSALPGSMGGPFGPFYASCDNPNDRVVDAVFAKAERRTGGR